MKKEIVSSLAKDFESNAHQTENGVEFWFARELQHLLGYDEWRNFKKVIAKAKTACEVLENNIGDHFVEVNKMVKIGSETEREVEDTDNIGHEIPLMRYFYKYKSTESD